MKKIFSLLLLSLVLTAGSVYACGADADCPMDSTCEGASDGNHGICVKRPLEDPTAQKPLASPKAPCNEDGDCPPGQGCGVNKICVPKAV